MRLIGRYAFGVVLLFICVILFLGSYENFDIEEEGEREREIETKREREKKNALT